jgi:TPR repeat protein
MSGYVQAQMNLASFYMENDGEAPIDYKKSYAWYYIASINGSKNAESELNWLTEK